MGNVLEGIYRVSFSVGMCADRFYNCFKLPFNHKDRYQACYKNNNIYFHGPTLIMSCNGSATRATGQPCYQTCCKLFSFDM